MHSEHIIVNIIMVFSTFYIMSILVAVVEVTVVCIPEMIFDRPKLTFDHDHQN